MKTTVMVCALGFAMLTGPAAGQDAESDERVWKLYDVRDLIGLLPPVAVAPPPSAPSAPGDPFAVMRAFPSPPSDAAAVEELVARLCGSFAAPHERLVDGVYGIETDEATHATLLRMLTEVRDLHAERYVVELTVFSHSEGERPVIGKAITPPASAAVHAAVVTRRTPTPIQQIVRHRFISDMSPVVANGVVAYDPETELAIDGLQVTITVGAAPDAEAHTAIRLVGEIAEISLGRLPERRDSGMDSSPAIELPTETMRTLRSDVRVPHSAWTTLAVAPGFREGLTIVVAARVEPIGRE